MYIFINFYIPTDIISQSCNINLRGNPNLEVINGYISHTRTSTGLEVSSEIISLNYLTEPQKKDAQRKGLMVHGITNSDLLKDKLCIEFIGDDVDLRRWNYIIVPHRKEDRWKKYEYPEAA